MNLVQLEVEAICNGSSWYASYRSRSTNSYWGESISFRIQLYVK